MEYEINFTTIGIILLDIVMLWACWRIYRHFSRLEFADKHHAAGDGRHRPRSVHHVKDSLETDQGEF
jgi:ABC-type nickel/cobalt efflux system permease component RcnA